MPGEMIEFHGRTAAGLDEAYQEDAAKLAWTNPGSGGIHGYDL